MANKIYSIEEATVTWTDTTGDLAMSVNGLAAGTGRQGAVNSFGTTAKANRYMWRAFCEFATTPVLDETVQIYIKTSDGTHPDNNDGTGDIVLSSTDKLKNLIFLGSIIVDEASTGVEMVASGFIELDVDEVMPVMFNNTVDALVATNNLNGFIMTPVPLEIQ